MKWICAVALALLLCREGIAQTYPTRPVRVVVPLSPGGFADIPTRLLAPRLAAALGGALYVENRPGAGGTIGAEFVAHSAPDGHTLLAVATPHVISPWLYKNLTYDVLRDFTPIVHVAAGPYVLVVNPKQLPAASVSDLIAAARARPGAIDFASSGNGSAQHLVGALFNSMAGVALNHVPYKGSGPAMQDLVSGQVSISFAGVPNVLAHLKAGRLRALAVTSAKRWAELPDVPTLAESGIPGYEATLWLGFAAPPRTPQAIVQRLYAETAKVLQNPELQQSYRAAGVEAQLLGPQEFAALMQTEYEKWGKVVRATGAIVN